MLLCCVSPLSIKLRSQATTLRHRLQVFPDAPHGYYLVDDDRDKGQSEIFAFFQGDDALQALQDLRLARNLERSISLTQGQGPSKPEMPDLDVSSGLPSPLSTRPRLPKGFSQGAQASHSPVIDFFLDLIGNHPSITEQRPTPLPR